MSSDPSPARIITFYSYKGGTGRSMAVANIAWILASNHKRVLVLDWDLEAPGLQRYFRPFLVDKDLMSSEGVVDLITDFILEAITPLEEGETLPKDWFVPLAEIQPYVISLKWKFPKGGKIDFVPAGRQGPDYAARFAAINFQRFYDVLGGGAFLEAVKEQMRPHYDYILIDSRTGVSDTSGICTVQMPDTLVVCFTFNNQSIEGASSITQDVYGQRTQSSTPAGEGESSSRSEPGVYKTTYDFQVVPVPMRVDPFEQEKLKLRKKFAHWKFNPFIARIPDHQRKAFWFEVEVPYLPYFAYEEILAPFQEEPDDPKSCLAAFTRITGQITNGEVSEFNARIDPELKAQVLKEFASTSMPGQDDIRTTSTGNLIEKDLRLAESTYKALSSVEQVEARRLWTRLVRVPLPGERVENSRVRVGLDELNEGAQPLVQKLVASELLLIKNDDKTEHQTLEVANEELLRAWPSLQEWIEKDRKFLVRRQQLQTKVAEWIDGGHEAAELLRGDLLKDAESWLNDRRADLSDREVSYIEASRDAQQQRNRKLRLSLVAAAVLVVLSIPLLFGLNYLIKKRNQKQTAAQLTTEAERILSAAAATPGKQHADQLQLGLLLAVEAERLSASGTTEALLKKYLPLFPRRIANRKLDDSVLGVSLANDGKTFVTVTGRPQPGNKVAQVQNTLSGSILSRKAFDSGPQGFELSPDGRYLAVKADPIEGRNPNVPKFDVSVFDIARQYRLVASLSHTSKVSQMTFSANGHYFATGSSDGTAQVLDLTKALVVRSLKSDRAAAQIVAVAFSPDSEYIAATDAYFVAHVCPSLPGQLERTFKVDDLAVPIALGLGGEYLATVSVQLGSSDVMIWSTKSGGKIDKVSWDSKEVQLAFSPDGRFIVVAGKGGFFSVRDFARHEEKATSNLYLEGDVSKIAFSPNGKYLAAIGNSNVARVWHYTDGGFQDAGFLVHDGNVNDLAFSNGSLLVTAGADGAVRVWDLDDILKGDLKQDEPCGRLMRSLTIEEWNQYLSSLGSYRRTCPEPEAGK